MSKHTPGPWISTGLYGGYIVRMRPDGTRQILAEVMYNGNEQETVAANRRLLAAAPDLLAACEQALALLGDTDPYLRALLEAAIHKAHKGVT